jgi:divalent metal cation (Fe/Co/Zn/Cd) transporter
VAITDEGDRRVLVRRGFALEWVTLGWNVAGVIVVAIAAAAARSVALAGFGLALAIYLLVQSTVVLAVGYRQQHSLLGIIWTAVTAAAMVTLAAGKARTGRALDNPVLRTEGRVTMIDGVLAIAVLLGLTLNAGLGWWWADAAAGYVLVYYATREVREIFADCRWQWPCARRGRLAAAGR